MNFFSKPIAIGALVANIVAIASALVTVATPLHGLLGDKVANYIVDGCLVVVALGSAHLSWSPSIKSDSK
jgi:hypothetical protein